MITTIKSVFGLLLLLLLSQYSQTHIIRSSSNHFGSFPGVSFSLESKGSSTSSLYASALLLVPPVATKTTKRPNGNGCFAKQPLLLLQFPSAIPTRIVSLATPATPTALRLSSSSPSSSSSSTSKPVTPAVGKVLRQTAALDGAEWLSVRSKLLREHNDDTTATKKKSVILELQSIPSFARTTMGVYTVVMGSIQGQRVVGMQQQQQQQTVVPEGQGDSSSSSTGSITVVSLDQDPSVRVYSESVAHIPDNVSEMDAVWTMLQSLSMIHCVRPVLTNLGGTSNTLTFAPPRSCQVVVLGGTETACTAARILAQLEYPVVLVAADKPNGVSFVPSSSSSTTAPPGIRHLTPTTGEDGLGFGAVLGQFDAVLDVLGSEFDKNSDMAEASTVIKLLAEQHGCHTYVSMQTASQDIVVQNGLIWGPAKSKEHVTQLQGRSLKATAAYFPSPIAFGATVQALLENGAILPPPPKQQPSASSVYVRGWTLKDFWDYTTWPRDANSNKRFGFPGLDRSIYDYDDEDEDDEYGDDKSGSRPMVSAPPMSSQEIRPDMFMSSKEDDDDSHPFVMNINDVKGLQQIVQDELTCVLFLSAPFCRTCRYLNPSFQRMARQHSEQQQSAPKNTNNNDTTNTNIVNSTSDSLVFVKAQASGGSGKELGRALGIDSVPSFVLFRKGRRYGQPLSVSKLPSKKLQLAMSYLQEDKAWDNALFGSDSNNSDGGFEGGSGRGSSPRSSIL